MATPDLEAHEELTPTESVAAVEEVIAHEEPVIDFQANEELAFEEIMTEDPVAETEAQTSHHVEPSVDDAVQAAIRAADIFNDDNTTENEELINPERKAESEGQV